MTKQDIIDYVTHTPGNTNKAVLSSMLNQFSNNSNSNWLEVTATADEYGYSYALNKTWQEISDAFPQVYIVFSNPNSQDWSGFKTTVDLVYADEENSYYHVFASYSGGENVKYDFFFACTDKNQIPIQR